MDGETGSPLSALKPEDISCFIQRPFLTAFLRWIRLLGQVFRFLSEKIIQLVVVVAVEM